MVQTGDIIEGRCLLLDQGGDQVEIRHRRCRRRSFQTEGRDILGGLIRKIIFPVEVILVQGHLVDGRILPVPEPGDVDLLADIGFTEDSLANHAARRQRNGRGRSPEAARMVAVQGILDITGRLAQFPSQTGRIGERQQDAVPVESHNLLDIDAVQQRNGDLPALLDAVVIPEGQTVVDAGEIHVDRVPFQHHGTLVGAQVTPDQLGIMHGFRDHMHEGLFNLPKIGIPQRADFRGKGNPHAGGQPVRRQRNGNAFAG